MRNSMTQQRRFRKEFAEEAVRLVQTSGRTQREIAGDLGIGRSTLVRWIGRSRDRRAVDPSAAASDVTAELKRLRRGKQNLRQGGGNLEKGPPFFPPGGRRWGLRSSVGGKRDSPPLPLAPGLGFVQGGFLPWGGG